MGKIYVYLSKRDKSTIKILTILNGAKCPPTKIENVESLKLSENLTNFLKNAIEEHKMLWEFWMESSEDFAELREKLKKRGIKKLPAHAASAYTSKDKGAPAVVKKPKVKTMLRRKGS